jgi:hypothetical protein
MTRLVMLVTTFVLLGANKGMAVDVQQSPDSVFIAADQTLTEEQVRAKMQLDGWSDVELYRNGRYFRVTASKNGQTEKFTIDSQTGRLSEEDDDDD